MLKKNFKASYGPKAKTKAKAKKISKDVEKSWWNPHQDLATKTDVELVIKQIRATERKIMSALSDFLTKQKVFNDRQAKAIDATVDSIIGLTEDIKGLNEKITELQESSGAVTPEDQALINELEAQGEAIAVKLEAAAEGLKGLDALTPPAPPAQ